MTTVCSEGFTRILGIYVYTYTLCIYLYVTVACCRTPTVIPLGLNKANIFEIPHGIQSYYHICVFFYGALFVGWLLPKRFRRTKARCKITAQHSCGKFGCLFADTHMVASILGIARLVAEPGLAILRCTIPAAKANNKTTNPNNKRQKPKDRQPNPRSKP